MEKVFDLKVLSVVFLVLFSLGFASAAVRTQITVDFLEGSGRGDFLELGFYEDYDDEIFRTPIVSGSELRDIPGMNRYVVKGDYTLDRMYVKSRVNGKTNYWYTNPYFNSDGRDHFASDGYYFWFEGPICYDCQCNFDDFGFRLVDYDVLYYVAECDDGRDNDGDGLRDEKDPGCWDNPLYPDSYNPEIDDESRYDIACYTDFECGKEHIVESYCEGDDVYDLVEGGICQKAGTGLSYCVDDSFSRFVETCEHGCNNGMCRTYADDDGPNIDLLKPEDGQRFLDEVLFVYLPEDESGISECGLVIDGEERLISKDVINGEENEFSFLFEQDGSYKAKIVCSDDLDNVGESEEIEFYIGEEEECSYDYECGREDSNYYCEGDDVMRDVQMPLCVSGFCEVDESTEFVKTCNSGCLNGRCKSGGGDDDSNDYCPDGDCDDVVMINQGLTMSEGSSGINVSYVDDDSDLVDDESEQGFDVIYLLIIVLVLLILLILIMIAYLLLSGGKKKELKKRDR